MNRGFAFYFKNAIKSSASTIWKNKNILQVWAYFLAELAARLTIIFSAIFDLANIRQAKVVRENGKTDIPETMKVATKGKPLGTMVLTIITEAFIFLGGALIIAVATVILYFIGFIVSELVAVPWYTPWLFCIPGGLVLLAYAVVMILILSPTPYLIETNPDLSVAETIKICFDTMKSKGKTTAFLNFFIPTLLEAGVLGICGGALYFLWLFVPLKFKLLACAGGIIVSAVLIFLTIPMFDLAKKLAQRELFEDIVSDPTNAGKRTAGINIKACNGMKFEKSEIKGSLVALFDDTQSDSIPAPDSPARKKLKEKAEKAALNREKHKEVKSEIRDNAVAQDVQPAQPIQPAQSVQPQSKPEVQISEPTEPVSVRSVMEQLNEPVSGESEEFDLDKFVPEKFDLDKFIDSQVAEAQYVPPAQPTAEPTAEPAVEQPSEAVAEKPKRTRTAKPKTADAGEEKPKRTRTAKSNTAGNGEEKPEQTETSTEKTSE
ncbi:MAG: hypothetical protein J1G07_05095 [Clostridiales bacterium]|nr:hypothetical protein [Clostridiales bacterium]